jgi:Papain-like cysteine protease AvrRpt2
MADDQEDEQTTNDQSGSETTEAGQETPSSVSFDVEGDVPAVAQPKSMACWATVTTMNMSWKNQQSYSIESAMDSLGSDFRKIFDENPGLAPNRVQDLSDATRMKVEYQACETPDSILRLLQNYGPLVVIDDEDQSPAFAVHARVIRGIYGDGEVANTYLKIIDPDGGKTYDESFQNFTSKYEAMADAKGWNLQMMHY